MAGFSWKTAILDATGNYITVEGRQAAPIHPSSVLHGQKREAIMFIEYVFTKKNYAKTVSAIEESWILEAMNRTAGGGT